MKTFASLALLASCLAVQTNQFLVVDNEEPGAYECFLYANENFEVEYEPVVDGVGTGEISASDRTTFKANSMFGRPPTQDVARSFLVGDPLDDNISSVKCGSDVGLEMCASTYSEESL